MADLSPAKRGTPRVLRVLLYGHAGNSQDRFARDIGFCCDALLREDINIEITAISSSSQLLKSIDEVEHDFVFLVFTRSTHGTGSQDRTYQEEEAERFARREDSSIVQDLAVSCDFVRLVRQRTLKPIFVLRDSRLLKHMSRQEIKESGADLVLPIHFSFKEFAGGLRRFIHRTAFKTARPKWPAPTKREESPAQLQLQLPAPVRVFKAVSAVYSPAIRHTLATCLEAVEIGSDDRTWVDVCAPTADALLNEEGLREAGLVVVLLNNLDYPGGIPEEDRYLWLIRELRLRTAAFIITLNAHWHSEEALRETEEAGADLALPVPYVLEEVFDAVRSAHAIWASGR